MRVRVPTISRRSCWQMRSARK